MLFDAVPDKFLVVSPISTATWTTAQSVLKSLWMLLTGFERTKPGLMQFRQTRKGATAKRISGRERVGQKGRNDDSSKQVLRKIVARRI